MTVSAQINTDKNAWVFEHGVVLLDRQSFSSALIWSAVASEARYRFEWPSYLLEINPKRRRRFALPAHSKIGHYASLLSSSPFALRALRNPRNLRIAFGSQLET